MKSLLRWTPVAVASFVAMLVTWNTLTRDRPRAAPPAVEPDTPSAETVAVCHRTDWRGEVVADLVAGRITGAEARARFLEANRSDPTALRNLLHAFPGQTDEERTAYQLVMFVRVSKHPRASAVEAEVSRELLGRELPPGRPTDHSGP